MSWTDANGSSACPFPNGGGICASKVKWVATLAPRLGFVWNNILIYGKAGAAWARDEYTVSFPTIPTGNELGHQNRSGTVPAVGGEYGIIQNLSIKAEYDWLDFGSERMAVYRCATCTANGLPGGSFDEGVNVKQRINLFKVGINYRFWGF